MQAGATTRAPSSTPKRSTPTLAEGLQTLVMRLPRHSLGA
jgi:hypothetical protein